MTWEDIIKQDDLGILKVGDYIEEFSPNRRRDGVVISISIAMEENDAAGEYSSAVDVKKYDTSLKYQGSVVFGPSWRGGNYWTYLERITKIVPQGTPEFKKLTEGSE